MKAKNKKAVIYCRLAAQDQKLDRRLDVQEEKCWQYAEQKDYQVCEVFKEYGSGMINTRSQLKRLLRYCKINKKSVSIVIIYDPTRLSRSTTDLSAIKSELKERNIIVEYVFDPMLIVE